MHTQLLESIPGSTLTEEGFAPAKPKRDLGAEWDASVARLTALLENQDGLDHYQYTAALREAMTTDTFPLTFADSLAREMIARYKVADPGLMRICRRGVCRTFAPRKRSGMTD